LDRLSDGTCNLVRQASLSVRGGDDFCDAGSSHDALQFGFDQRPFWSAYKHNMVYVDDMRVVIHVVINL
jgi:hypothetical protein